MLEECIFCKISNHEAEADIVYETDDIIVFENIKPVADVHLLVIPKKHVATFMDIDDSNIIFEMTKACQRVVAEKEILSGYKMIFNGGKYQYVPHLHWHILGGKLNNEDLLDKTE